jgi:hypothetical protein
VDDSSWKYSSSDTFDIQTSAEVAGFTAQKVCLPPFYGDKKPVSENIKQVLANVNGMCDL